MSQFDRETTVTRNPDPASFAGYLHPSWNIGDNPNGGYLVSVVLDALRQSVPHPDPVSVTTHFLRPGTANEPCAVRVAVIRTGRSLSTVRGTLSQSGKDRIEVLAAFSDLSQPAGIDAPITLIAPTIPGPDDCVARTGGMQGVELPITRSMDIRLHPELANPDGAGKAEVAGWIRFRDGREPDVRSLIAFADAFPPSPLGLLGAVGWVPTIELTVHIRRRPAAGWIQAHFRTDDLKDGLMIESGALWDADGQLVAQSRQLGLVLAR
jgi:acyl-CoA thioesterase